MTELTENVPPLEKVEPNTSEVGKDFLSKEECIKIEHQITRLVI